MAKIGSTMPRTGVVPEQAALVPLPPKARRRWGLFASGILVTCIGVLGSVWLYQTTTTAVPVVVASRTLERGQIVDRGDLMIVHVEKDPALRTVPGEDLDSLVGQRALFDVVQGSPVAPGAVGESKGPDAGEALVSVPVDPSLVPPGLVGGDTVQVVSTEGQGSVDGAVFEVRSGEGKTVVVVVVDKSSATELAQIAGSGSGRVVIVLESRDR